MWAVMVEVYPPCRHQCTGMGQAVEQMFIQAIVAHPPVEAFNEAVLLRLSGRDIMPINASILNTLVNSYAGELSAAIWNDRPWHASFSDYFIQLTRNPLTGRRFVRNLN